MLSVHSHTNEVTDFHKIYNKHYSLGSHTINFYPSTVSNNNMANMQTCMSDTTDI